MDERSQENQLILIDLDNAAMARAIIVISHRGARASISRERLLELIRREEDLIAFLSRTPASAAVSKETANPALALSPPKSLPRKMAVDHVTHASLSTRIKKVYDYSAADQKVRPAHFGLLGEVLENFDWVIPDHPNTQLLVQLAEIGSWTSVPIAMKEQIADFLKRYAQARQERINGRTA